MRLHSPISALAALALAGCAAAPSAPMPQYYGQFQMALYVDVGQRSLDSSFDPADEQTMLGVTLDIREPRADSGVEIGLHHGWESKSKSFAGVGSVSFESTSTDFSVGGRWKGQPLFGNLRPVFGGGVALIFVDYSVAPPNIASTSDSAWSIGPYGHAGLEWTFNEHVSLLLDYRRVMFTDLIVDVEILDAQTDADYSQFSLSLGYTF